MLSINIRDNSISLKDIKVEQLESILAWCNMTYDFSFASGIRRPVTYGDLIEKYTRIASGDNEFFLGIGDPNEGGRLVGIITGKLAGSSLWIYMLAIDFKFRGKGYGSKAVNLLLGHMAGVYGVKSAYLAVAVNNIKGRRFWMNNGFVEERQLLKRVVKTENGYSVIIMQKRL